MMILVGNSSNSGGDNIGLDMMIVICCTHTHIDRDKKLLQYLCLETLRKEE